MSNQGGPQAEIPQDVQERMNAWWKIFRSQQISKNFIGIVSITASSLAAARIFPQVGTAALAVTAAILTSILTFLGLSEKASAYMTAWRVVDRATFRHRKNPTEDTRKALYDAIEEGERIIAPVDR